VERNADEEQHKFTLEAPAIECCPPIDADATLAALDRLIATATDLAAVRPINVPGRDPVSA
jgi:hypothetical protein